MPELRSAGRASSPRCATASIRSASGLPAADPRLAYIGEQFGMFSMLPLNKEQVLEAPRASMRSTWPTAGASTSWALATSRSIDLSPPWSRRWTLIAMADRDPGKVSADVNWREVARLVLTSREMDRLEEQELVPAKKVLYQFSARGHDMAQVLLGLQLKDGDAACGYYRSRPLLLALGVPLADALGSGMGLAGGYSDGRDIGVVFNYPNPGGAHALPMCGGVGAQYTPAAGWAQAIEYKTKC